MRIDLTHASGRARCQICGTRIERGETNLAIRAYHNNQNFHARCITDAIEHFNNFGTDDTYTFRGPILPTSIHYQDFLSTGNIPRPRRGGERPIIDSIESSNEDRIK